jgi:hypothetical protein
MFAKYSRFIFNTMPEERDHAPRIWAIDGNALFL